MDARKPDLDALRRLADTDDGSDAELDRLRAVANLQTPDPASLNDSATSLEAAFEAVTNAAETAAGRADRLERLLTAAHEHIADSGTETCPVCGTEEVLTESWKQKTLADLESLKVDAAAATDASARLNDARKSARTAIVGAPKALQADDATESQQAAAAAWTTWSDTPNTDAELVARLRVFDEVIALVEVARTEAGEIIEQRDLSWRPHARAIGNWVEQTEASAAATARGKEIKQAEDQLKAAIATIRDERFGPIADRSRELWGILRHRSNVQLEAVDLTGANTKRRVELNVTVDGEQSAALGVMSQGELHALALSLFLPRATMDESPFRFVMIDDPVQAMDPARVDGLARVLEQISQTHQVIVFTHDDRLPESVRRLQIPAEVTEVTRQPGSKVSTRPVQDPVSTAIDDARAVAYTSEMSPAAMAKVVPFYCRTALEAAASGSVRRRMINSGHEHREVEKTIAATANLRKLAAMALFDDPGRAGDVNDYLKEHASPRAPWVLHWCNAGTHGELDANPKDLVKATEQVAHYLGSRG
jgi:ABC-type lipoprotein export system ATPase subunit